MTSNPAPASWADLLELVERLDASDYADVSVELPGLSLRMSRHALPAAGVAPLPSQAPPPPPARPPAPDSVNATPANAVANAAPVNAAPANAVANDAPANDAPANAAPANAGANAAEATEPASTSSANLVEVTAPLLGVLHRRPAPDQPPFVAVGDEVEEETTVAIIEVMKMMNHVPAGVTGRVAEILVQDGDLVEFDQVLLRIDPRSAP